MSAIRTLQYGSRFSPAITNDLCIIDLLFTENFLSVVADTSVGLGTKQGEQLILLCLALPLPPSAIAIDKSSFFSFGPSSLACICRHEKAAPLASAATCAPSSSRPRLFRRRSSHCYSREVATVDMRGNIRARVVDSIMGALRRRDGYWVARISRRKAIQHRTQVLLSHYSDSRWTVYARTVSRLI